MLQIWCMWERVKVCLKCFVYLQEKTTEEAPKKEEEEEVDIDLTDPDVENAALKIQAGFKGMKARQEIKEIKV